VKPVPDPRMYRTLKIWRGYVGAAGPRSRKRQAPSTRLVTIVIFATAVAQAKFGLQKHDSLLRCNCRQESDGYTDGIRSVGVSMVSGGVELPLFFGPGEAHS
jgi:hypothetical protein